MDQRLERILPRVQKPARYVGGEYNHKGGNYHVVHTQYFKNKPFQRPV